jgi:hypothetical protein
VTRRTSSRFTIASNVVRGLLVGLAVCLFGVAADNYLYFRGGGRLLATAEDIVIGTFVALLVVLYLERRRRYVEERLRLIANMNHIVRNELEIITYSAHATQNADHIRHIRQCAEHIEWALQEVLPGHEDRVAPPRPGPARAELGNDRPARNAR